MDGEGFHNNASLDDAEAIRHLREAISKDRHWYIALLEAIGLWSSPRELFQGRECKYLVGNEAFDWLLLAERLCEEIDGLIPEREMTELLFRGRPPLELSPQEFKSLIGGPKYRAYLNYFYGVIIEEAILLALEDEVLKEHSYQGLTGARLATERAYYRLYGAGESELLVQFRGEKGREQIEEIGLDELQEFSYWRFQYRLLHCDGARVASDTKKGLRKLHELRRSHLWYVSPQDSPASLVEASV
ncbi:MAG: hypothetical protein HW403_419 [Dehalococcoidia bacterium]|nr:hypothetical protein [Dehalococcoidia bacterium]